MYGNTASVDAGEGHAAVAMRALRVLSLKKRQHARILEDFPRPQRLRLLGEVPGRISLGAGEHRWKDALALPAAGRQLLRTFGI